MNKNVIGLDVGRGSAVLCCLDEFPMNIQQTYKLLVRNHSFVKICCNKAGVDKLLSIKPTAIVLEPTGHWYSHFWATVAVKYDFLVHWISHTDLDKLRGSYGFTNKRDSEDALCLAASYFDPRFIDERGQKRYLSFYYDGDRVLTALRERFLEKEQLQKLRSALIVQLRQRLAYEYPEAASSKLAISNHQGFTPLVGWLSGRHRSTRIINKYAQSVVHELGISISPYTRNHSSAIVDVESRIVSLKHGLRTVLEFEEYQPYFSVFDRFGFGLDNKILLLYHIYPFEKFLTDGKPWIEHEVGSNGKLQKRDRSLRKFQAYLGMSYSYRQSGTSEQKTFHGSRLVRSHLYPWVVCKIAPAKARIDSPIGHSLKTKYQQYRVNVRGKDAIIRIMFVATRWLYRELLTELTD